MVTPLLVLSLLLPAPEFGHRGGQQGMFRVRSLQSLAAQTSDILYGNWHGTKSPTVRTAQVHTGLAGELRHGGCTVHLCLPLAEPSLLPAHHPSVSQEPHASCPFDHSVYATGQLRHYFSPGPRGKVEHWDHRVHRCFSKPVPRFDHRQLVLSISHGPGRGPRA